MMVEVHIAVNLIQHVGRSKKMTLRGDVNSPEAMGRILAQGRLLRGLTQRQLAKELGIDQKYVWSIEQGKPSLYTDRLFAMMRATGVKFIAEIAEPNSTDALDG
jgi:ribosome-binding protein aMBF1 (putative translation factor)